MQSFHRHRPQYFVMLYTPPLLTSAIPPNLPYGNAPAERASKMWRKSAVGAGRSPLRFWSLLTYTKSDSPQAKFESIIKDVRFFAALRMTDNMKHKISGQARNDKVGECQKEGGRIE